MGLLLTYLSISRAIKISRNRDTGGDYVSGNETRTTRFLPWRSVIFEEMQFENSSSMHELG